MSECECVHSRHPLVSGQMYHFAVLTTQPYLLIDRQNMDTNIHRPYVKKSLHLHLHDR